jgi:hypothetical protein
MCTSLSRAFIPPWSPGAKAAETGALSDQASLNCLIEKPEP